jgi:hypothetical protein
VQGGRHREIMDGHVREELGVEVLDEAAELVIRCLSLTAEDCKSGRAPLHHLHEPATETISRCRHVVDPSTGRAPVQ